MKCEALNSRECFPALWQVMPDFEKLCTACAFGRMLDGRVTQLERLDRVEEIKRLERIVDDACGSNAVITVRYASDIVSKSSLHPDDPERVRLNTILSCELIEVLP